MGASVIVLEAPGPVPDISPMSNEQGKFALDALTPGNYRLRAFGPANETGETRVTVLKDRVADAEIVVGPR